MCKWSEEGFGIQPTGQKTESKENLRKIYKENVMTYTGVEFHRSFDDPLHNILFNKKAFKALFEKQSNGIACLSALDGDAIERIRMQRVQVREDERFAATWAYNRLLITANENNRLGSFSLQDKSSSYKLFTNTLLCNVIFNIGFLLDNDIRQKDEKPSTCQKIYNLGSYTKSL